MTTRGFMKKNVIPILLLLSNFSTIHCAGVKVINPQDESQRDVGTKMVDWSSGSPKIVETYSCRLKSMGNKISALGKTEELARKEVLARCHDRTLISFCKSEDIVCSKN